MNLRMSGWLWGLGLIALVGVLACQPSEKAGKNSLATPSAKAQTGWFKEVAIDSGLAFFHENGAAGNYYLPEIMGSGSAVFDFDGDGDLDVFLIQSGPFPPHQTPEKARDRLFRNDSNLQASPKLRFTDVTEESGIRADGYGMGACVADYDRDGWPDLYVTNYGNNQLWRNLGNGTFEDVTIQANANDPRWSVSASFCDFNRDGWPDLVVTNYVVFSKELHRPCMGSTLDYCHPRSYEPEAALLLANKGDGTFEDVSVSSGIATLRGRALGVVIADLNGDNLEDIYVANDAMDNFLWTNQGDGSFKETGLFAGVALNLTGQPEGSMGVDVADFDNDGDEDVFISHLRKETNTLYRNGGQGFFEDVSNPSGLGQPSLPFTGFGTGWADFDQDGLLDLFVANGSVAKLEDLIQNQDPLPYHQRNQVFRQTQPGTFVEVTQSLAGAIADHSEVSRGTSFCDIDNDGDMDLLVSNNNGPVRLYVNHVPSQAWIGFVLPNQAGLPYLDQTKITLTFSDGSRVHHRFHTDGSYLSTNDPRLLIGLGKKPPIQEILVAWPGGFTSKVLDFQAGRYQTLSFPSELTQTEVDP